MNEFLLNRGKSQIHLTKSKNLIGVRPIGTQRSRVNFAGHDEKLISTQQYLGGFELFDIKSDLNNSEQILDEIRSKNQDKTGTHVYHIQEQGASYVPTGKISVRFADEHTVELNNEIQQEFKLLLVRTDPPKAPGLPETFTFSVTAASPNPLKVALALQRRHGITMAEADLSTPGRLHNFLPPTDQYFQDQWHLDNVGTQFGQSWGMTAGADARVVKAWEALGNFGLKDCIIAILDDGFDLKHPDLADTSRIITPYDFEKRTSDPSPQNFLPWPGDIHGTACAGLALGAATGECIVGVAPGCSFMPLRWSRNLNDDAIRSWFGYVKENNAWVVSCSWTGPEDYTMSTLQIEAITDCATNGRNGLGCVIVFCAGNEFVPVSGFATHPEVITVSSCTSNDEQSHMSSYGKTVTVCAPSTGSGGRKILTANVTGMVQDGAIKRPVGYSDVDQNFTAEFGGTSAATPIVSGVCGLILSVAPHLKADQVKEILKKSARKIGPSHGYKSGHSDYFGFGCVNALDAINLAKSV